MHMLPLSAMLRASAILWKADGTTRTRSYYRQALYSNGGMRPNLRLALGLEAATDLVYRGFGGWWLEPLLTGDSAGFPLVTTEAQHAGLLRLVDVLFRDVALKQRMVTLENLQARVYPYSTIPNDPLLQQVLARIGCLVEANYNHRLDEHYVEILAEIADVAGLPDPFEDVPELDADLWTTVKEPATVIKIENYSVRGAIPASRIAYIRTASGLNTKWHQEQFPKLEPELRKGMKVLLTFNARTPEHNGFITRVEDLDMIESMAAIHKSVEDWKRQEAPGDMANVAIDAAGRIITAGMRVKILDDCLETHAGNRGNVNEVLGDLVIVRFNGRKSPVPCYAAALQIIEEAA